ncbi:hypothetical protein SEVIR_9G484225v4 [Setaria viridis]
MIQEAGAAAILESWLAVGSPSRPAEFAGCLLGRAASGTLARHFSFVLFAGVR